MAGTGAAVKVGPWGASGGRYNWDIDPATKPVRLESITVYSSNLPVGHISGISFVYLDEQWGRSIHVGPGGMTQGEGQTVVAAAYSSSTVQVQVQVQVAQFSLSQGEYVTCMAGTFDGDGVTSLTFTTNHGEYGPFGCPSGTPFRVPPSADGAVVAFFGFSVEEDNGESLVAIGAYIAPKPELAASNAVQIHGSSRSSSSYSYTRTATSSGWRQSRSHASITYRSS